MSFIGGQPAGQLTPDQIYQLAVKHGFKPGPEAATATAIAQAESRGIVNNFNPDDPSGGSVGLMQINGANARLLGGGDWKTAGTDPDASMAAAYRLYASKGNFRDWGAYNNGSYRQFAHGTTLNSIPLDPSIRARGGVETTPVPETAVAAAPAPTPTMLENLQKGDYGAALAQFTGKTEDGSGKEKASPLEKFADSFKPKEAPAAPEASSGMLPQDSTPMIAPAAQQLLASTFANAAKPLSWSSQPWGYGTAGPQVPGMTLNSGGPYV